MREESKNNKKKKGVQKSRNESHGECVGRWNYGNKDGEKKKKEETLLVHSDLSFFYQILWVAAEL